MLLRAMSQASVVLLGALLATGCSNRPESKQAGEAVATSGLAGEVAAPAQSAAAEPFDINKVPLTASALPPFPYLDWPAAVPDAERKPERSNSLDALTVIAGKQLVDVVGRLEVRSYAIPNGMSQIEIRRVYANQIKALGGVQVNLLQPTTPVASIAQAVQDLAGPDVDLVQRLGLQRYSEGSYEYEVYLLRAPEVTAWIVVQTSQFSVVVTALVQQPVG